MRGSVRGSHKRGAPTPLPMAQRVAEMLELLRTPHPKGEEIWRSAVDDLAAMPAHEAAQVWCRIVEDMAVRRSDFFFGLRAHLGRGRESAFRTAYHWHA